MVEYAPSKANKERSGGRERAATNALKASGKFIPWRVVTVAIDGHIID